MLHAVHDYGIYGDVGKRIFYHPECLELVEIEVEKHGHLLVDMAININDLKKQNIKGFNSDIFENHKKRMEKLHQQNFERMMPTK